MVQIRKDLCLLRGLVGFHIDNLEEIIWFLGFGLVEVHLKVALKARTVGPVFQNNHITLLWRTAPVQRMALDRKTPHRFPQAAPFRLGVQHLVIELCVGSREILSLIL